MGFEDDDDVDDNILAIQDVDPESPAASESPGGGAKWDDARLAIIGELQNENSDIHLILSAATTQAEKGRRILARYAPSHTETNRVQSIVRLLRDLKQKKGPHFSDEAKEERNQNRSNKSKPFWKTAHKFSDAAMLLYYLLYHKERTGADKMSVKQIYEHHDVFKQYDFADFSRYHANMITLANKHR